MRCAESWGWGPTTVSCGLQGCRASAASGSGAGSQHDIDPARQHEGLHRTGPVAGHRVQGCHARFGTSQCSHHDGAGLCRHRVDGLLGRLPSGGRACAGLATNWPGRASCIAKSPACSAARSGAVGRVFLVELTQHGRPFDRRQIQLALRAIAFGHGGGQFMIRRANFASGGQHIQLHLAG